MHCNTLYYVYRDINQNMINYICQPQIKSMIVTDIKKITTYTTLNIDTVPRSHSTTTTDSMQILATLINPENGTSKTNKLNQRPKGKRFRLENALQERKVDDAGLAGQGAQNGVVEHLVSEEGHFTAKDRFAFAAAGESVEHVEEDETGEGHGCVMGGYDAGSLVDW
jgi:hypothetical protein